MSSFFSSLAESLLTELSMNMGILEQLHTVSIEFTVMRENTSVIGLEVNIQYLLAEQKSDPRVKLPLNDVEKGYKRIVPLH